MSEPEEPQASNIGFLRMAVEDAFVTFLGTLNITVDRIGAAYTDTERKESMVVVHAVRTRKVSETDSLARYVDVEFVCYTYAESTTTGGVTVAARARHFALVDAVYSGLAQSDLVSKLNTPGTAKVTFWQAFIDTDEGGSEQGQYLTKIMATIGASPKEDPAEED